jgi:hypothetical protein
MKGKRSGPKAKSVGGARRGKSKVKVKQGLKDLDVRSAKEVRGGRKAGQNPLEY